MVNLIKYLIGFFIFCKWWFYNKNFYDTSLFVGKKGCGKTTHIAKMSNYYIKKGFKVYCNVDMPGCYIYDPKNLNFSTFEENSIVFLDEIGLVFNNRNFKSFDKGQIEFWKYARQYKIKIYTYSQALDADAVIVRLIDKLYLMSRIGRITLIKPVIKKIGISKDNEGQGRLVDTYFYSSIFSWSFIYLPRYFGYFKTYNPPSREIIKSTLQDYTEIQKIYSDFKSYVIYKTKTIIKQLKEFIIKNIKILLNKNDYKVEKKK